AADDRLRVLPLEDRPRVALLSGVRPATRVTTLGCPGCSQPMTSQALQGKYGQPLGLDLCFGCGVAWFDGYESLLLAPGAILALFTAIHEHRAEQQRRPLGSPACPRCRV